MATNVMFGSTVRTVKDASGNVVGLSAGGGQLSLPALGALKKGQSKGRKLLDFGTLTGAAISSGGGITMELIDVNVPEIGKIGKSIKITVDAGLSKTFTAPAFVAGSNPNQTFSLAIENLTTTSCNVSWRTGVASSWADYYTRDMVFTKYGLQYLSGGNSSANTDFETTAGEPTFSTLTLFRFNITAPADRPAVVIFHELYAAIGGLPVVEIIVDDGYMSSYTELLPLLNKYGLKCGIGVISNLVGVSENWMTELQLQEMHDAGHDMLVHGDTTLYDFATLQAALDSIDQDAAYVRQRNWRGGNLYIYPGGHAKYSDDDQTSIQTHLANTGFDGAYITAGARTHRKGDVAKYRISRQSLLSSTTSAAVLTSIEHAALTGQSIALCMHDIVPSGATGDKTNRATIEEIFAGIAAFVSAGKVINLAPTVACELLK